MMHKNFGNNLNPPTSHFSRQQNRVDFELMTNDLTNETSSTFKDYKQKASYTTSSRVQTTTQLDPESVYDRDKVAISQLYGISKNDLRMDDDKFQSLFASRQGCHTHTKDIMKRPISMGALGAQNDRKFGFHDDNKGNRTNKDGNSLVKSHGNMLTASLPSNYTM